jgi:hypothetical protein
VWNHVKGSDLQKSYRPKNKDSFCIFYSVEL